MTRSARRVCIAPPTSGPITGYRTHGCRCYTCSVASAAYERNRCHAIKNGTWKPQVDAGPVIEHLRMLRAAGIGPTLAARAAGLKPGLVVRYVSDQTRPLPKRIRSEAAEALLQVTVLAAQLAGSRVPALGSQRRARALSAIGWSMTEQARRIGLLQHVYTDSINRPQISAPRARQIADLYERLSGTPGPAPRAREHAQRHGWAPPLAWDDVDIDDPAARPSRFRLRKPDGRSNDFQTTTEREAA